MKPFAILCFVALLGISTVSVHAEPIGADAISVVDGDTIDVGSNRYRMVGYDTPEVQTPRRKVSADEKAVATVAKGRFAELLHSGPLDLTEVRCSCPSSTIGTRRCNGGRKCGILTVNGQNVGEILIAEGLAVPFKCGNTKCENMPDWPRIIRSQFPDNARNK